MTPEDFRAKAHGWFRRACPVVDAERGVLVVPGPPIVTYRARWQASSDGESWQDINPKGSE